MFSKENVVAKSLLPCRGSVSMQVSDSSVVNVVTVVDYFVVKESSGSFDWIRMVSWLLLSVTTRESSKSCSSGEQPHNITNTKAKKNEHILFLIITLQY